MKRRRSWRDVLWWAVSGIIVLSMLGSMVLMVRPAPQPRPTPTPAWPLPTATLTPTPEAGGVGG